MWTVKQVSARTGVSIRTLHHYDAIGLLRPTQTTEAGYRLYDVQALERLQCILLFRELKFPLKEIKNILDSPSFDREQALEQQITLLCMQKERIEALLDLARGIQKIGVNTLDFSAFDTTKLDEYAQQAKATWGTTEAYREFEQKAEGRTRAQELAIGGRLMDIFRQLGEVRQQAPDSPEAQALVAALRAFITEHYYTCTPEILRSLGEMYAAGGSMTENIDHAGGEGTASFACQAIAAYCRSL